METKKFPLRLENVPYGIVSLLNCYKPESFFSFINAWLNFIKPALPKIRMRGDQEFPPPLESKRDVVLILANHLSDMDHFFIWSKTNYHEKDKVPVQMAGFTLEKFATNPFSNNFVIGLRKGMQPDEIAQKIQSFLDRGFNTFFLFPEGKIMCKSAYQDSIKEQVEKGYTDPNNQFHQVLFPKFGAFLTFLELVQDRLKFIIDVTLDYKDHPLRDSEWHHHLYPSVFFSYLNKIPAPFMYVRTYPVQDWKTCASKEWLLALWRKKEKRLAKIRTMWNQVG